MLGPKDKTHDEEWAEYLDEYWDEEAVEEKEKDDDE
jgi:hypothetical protein